MKCLYLLIFLLHAALIDSFSLDSGTWSFRGHPIAFEKVDLTTKASVIENMANDVTSHRPSRTSTLLLNGFGVGSFHQHRLVREIAKHNQQGNDNHEIYCIDYLGQGRSWPLDCQDGEGPSEADLRYCGQTWVDQITAFIEEVVLADGNSEKVHIVGNSVGGHLAVFIAAQRPDLVESLALLNATPVWGLNLPGWNGKLPAPWFPKIVGRFLFDRIRDLQTIETYLEAAYFNRAAFDTKLIQQIRDCTEITDGGHAAFASILWSPPINLDRNESEEKVMFYPALASVDCDVLLMFGADDPWCKPAFARRMLERVPEHVASRYIECSKVGHCPNHEAPVATASVLSTWWQFTSEERKNAQLALPKSSVQEQWGQTELQERKSHEIELSLIDRLVVAFV